MSKKIPEGEELLKAATVKFMQWASRLDEREAATAMQALDALNIQEGSPESYLLAGFLGGLEAGMELVGGDAEG